jgi:hypothetical protein
MVATAECVGQSVTGFVESWRAKPCGIDRPSPNIDTSDALTHLPSTASTARIVGIRTVGRRRPTHYRNSPKREPAALSGPLICNSLERTTRFELATLALATWWERGANSHIAEREDPWLCRLFATQRSSAGLLGMPPRVRFDPETRRGVFATDGAIDLRPHRR